MFQPPVSRQPSCRMCGHEEHVYTSCELSRSPAELDDDAELSVPPPCQCPPHQPNGIY